MTKKGKLRKGIGILLAVCMALPVGFVTKSETVHGKVIDADITKRELWSTSFESADGFKTSTVDDMFLSFAALISFSLGFMNLLPIPPLDGGNEYWPGQGGPSSQSTRT